MFRKHLSETCMCLIGGKSTSLINPMAFQVCNLVFLEVLFVTICYHRVAYLIIFVLKNGNVLMLILSVFNKIIYLQINRKTLNHVC